jgi:hypothetical protein
MEIGVRKEYVITTKGTPLHSHCQVREGGRKEGVGKGEVDRKKNARVVVAASTAEGLGASSDEKPSCVGWISKFYIPSLSII